MPKRKVTKEKGSTNAAPLRTAGRFAAAHARVGPALLVGQALRSCTSTHLGFISLNLIAQSDS
ncbi:MAG: hypothetical protein ACKOE6_11540 [Flammeovirgaceae bacterium]